MVNGSRLFKKIQMREGSSASRWALFQQPDFMLASADDI